MGVSDVLRKAADILRTGGWIQQRTTDGNRHCAFGAIRAALGQYALGQYVHSSVLLDDAATPVVLALASQLPPLCGEYVDYRLPAPQTDPVAYQIAARRITAWNDAAYRTAPEVIAKLEAVAATLDAAAASAPEPELELVGA